MMAPDTGRGGGEPAQDQSRLWQSHRMARELWNREKIRARLFKGKNRRLKISFRTSKSCGPNQRDT